MTRDVARRAVLDALAEIAPEADPAVIPDGEPLREHLDIDSLDYLRFLDLLAASTGVEVPEADYEQVATLDGCIAYLAARAPT